ncbi:MAG: hypothetical protein E7399_08130, partial [Ruminococcaceae bacterium]|nr:hypothetical protein [Oscillospiraceae bacterium]
CFKRVVREVKIAKRKLNEEEAIHLAEEEMMQELSSQMPVGAEIVSVTQNIQTADSETITVDCTFECLENIAVQKIYDVNIQGELSNDTKNSDGE